VQSVSSFGCMRRELVPDALWKRVAPLLPRHRRRTRRGRPRSDDRAALRGILFVLKTGIGWEDLPAEVFGVSGITCWRRLEEWTRARVFERLQQLLLDELGLRGRIDWSRAAFDSGSVRAKKGGPKRAPTPPTEGKKAASITS
jgi:transposase